MSLYYCVFFLPSLGICILLLSWSLAPNIYPSLVSPLHSSAFIDEYRFPPLPFFFCFVSEISRSRGFGQLTMTCLRSYIYMSHDPSPPLRLVLFLPVPTLFPHPFFLFICLNKDLCIHILHPFPSLPLLSREVFTICSPGIKTIKTKTRFNDIFVLLLFPCLCLSLCLSPLNSPSLFAFFSSFASCQLKLVRIGSINVSILDDIYNFFFSCSRERYSIGPLGASWYS